MFASERQNVMKAVEYVRHSPIIGAKTPVHGLLVDIATGKLEWVVNGYQTFELSAATIKAEGAKLVDESADALRSLAAFKIGEMKFPDTKIGNWPPMPGTGWRKKSSRRPNPLKLQSRP